MQLGAMLAVMLGMGFGTEPPQDRLYGRVYTTDGVVLEGYLRWDRNEVSGSDFLDGAKELPLGQLREAESLDPEYAAAQRRARSLEAFGVRITWDLAEGDDPITVPSSIRFSHIVSLTVLDERRALVHLTSGEEVRLTGVSTDLGRGMRGIVIEDPSAEPATVRWRQLERVDFLPPPAESTPAAERLHGTVTTRSGVEFEGDIGWDLDEVLFSDLLDGREGREDHEIPFGDIVSIVRDGERASRVTLRDGTALLLRGTNDVDRDNRGIDVSDRLFGRVTVPWDAFESVEFRSAPRIDAVSASGQDIGPLRGTVYARDGRTISGGIRWGNDATAGWETLDGWRDGVDFAIEFGAIRSVGRNESGGVTVTLIDGRTVDLDSSDDVGESNMGIFVEPDGRATRLVRWRDFDRLEFQR
ncbi:MAG: hypothetical protein O2958_08475 [Gemmatimonadetes bacterium]|nr:hypothetical protein [Gemmatimonadota bacterium]MDA1104026.1 hypothetical protein [Gemmatimonadota bacterium]